MSLLKPQGMTLKYFLGEFHSGILNRLLHIIGFSLFLYGILKRDWMLALVVSPLVMESGHLYNHLILKKYKSKNELIRIIPLQVGGWLLSIGFLALILKLLKKI